jgi:serine/threonine protein phosphatase PrpC
VHHTSHATSRPAALLPLQRFGVIPDPDVTVAAREQGDQFLLLASDGIWAVLSNQEACDLVLLCMRKWVPPPPPPLPPLHLAGGCSAAQR